MRALAALSVAVVALLTGASGAGVAAVAPQHSIVVTGDGTVSTVPDRAQLSFGVTTTAKTASAALRANAAEMVKVITALKEQGAADIRTDFVSLSPRTNQNGDEIVGYSATNAVDVTLRDLTRIGAAIDGAVEAGANQVSGPNLVRSDQAALYRQALRAAIANAKGKAQTIASASGLHLRRITDVTESGGPVQLPTVNKAGVAPSTPIETGTQLVEATVTVTFSVS